MSEIPTNTIICGDCLSVLGTLPDGCIHCAVSSPPYWGLRDYGIPPVQWPEVSFSPMPGLPEITIPAMECCHGLEKDIWAYVGHEVLIFREVRRVLRDDGTLWLNLGDSYSSNGGRTSAHGPNAQCGNTLRETTPSSRSGPRNMNDLDAKQLCGIPWRVALALQADGWYLRMDNIWHKPNPMPESVTDRPTKAHEYVFLMSKSKDYYYDAEAIREPHKRLWNESNGGNLADIGHKKSGRIETKNTHPSGYPLPNPNGANRRSVWTVATHSFKEAHFATFPPELIRPCIKAGTSEKGCCPVCGAPWERIVDSRKTFNSGSGRSGNPIAGKNGQRCQGGGDTGDVRKGPVVESTTIGWRPTCECGATETVPCIILDPFGGAGTTGLVAGQERRDWILIEVNQKYCDMAQRRTDVVMKLPLFSACEPAKSSQPL